MNFEKELLSKEIATIVNKYIEDVNPYIVETVKTKSTEILSEVQAIIANHKLNDFEAVEEIVVLFEKHSLSCGGRHDF